jgi:hypothetical protein
MGSNHTTQRINEQIGTLATIEPEGHFVQVSQKMLGAAGCPTHSRFLRMRGRAQALQVPGAQVRVRSLDANLGGG